MRTGISSRCPLSSTKWNSECLTKVLRVRELIAYEALFDIIQWLSNASYSHWISWPSTTRHDIYFCQDSTAGGVSTYRYDASRTNHPSSAQSCQDTASAYGCEAEVGQAIRDSGIPRSQIWVTTKLDNQQHHIVSEAAQLSLTALDLEYIDLYLMHWPCPLDPEDFGKPLANWHFSKTW